MRLAENPRVYDAVQVLSGRKIAHRRIGRALAPATGEIVLDVGAGTGSIARVLAPGTDYWALDNDPVKLGRLREKVPNARCLQGTALDIDLPDGAVDWSVCVALAHHLDDDQLPRLVEEIARVTRTGLVFLDPLASTRAGVASFMWRYDRGSHPRSAATLLEQLRRCFAIEHEERFRIFHSYLLCVARPERPPAA